MHPVVLFLTPLLRVAVPSSPSLIFVNAKDWFAASFTTAVEPGRLIPEVISISSIDWRLLNSFFTPILPDTDNFSMLEKLDTKGIIVSTVTSSSCAIEIISVSLPDLPSNLSPICNVPRLALNLSAPCDPTI